MSVSDRVLSSDVSVVEELDVGERVKRRESECHARDGVEKTNMWGFVEGDEPAVRGTADSGAWEVEGEVVGFGGGEVEEGGGREDEAWALWWEVERGFRCGGTPAPAD